MVHLGQLLVDEGLVEAEGVERALDRQRHQGGHLGTNLLDEGVIGEESLLEALGRQRRAQTVSGRDLWSIPLDVLDLLPRDLAARHGLVPFRRRGRTLYLAAIEPSDAGVEDEIARRTSCLTRTCIGLELRVREALDRYYGVARDERLVRLAERLREEAPSSGRRPAAASTDEDVRSTAPLSFDELQLESLFSVPLSDAHGVPASGSTPPSPADGTPFAARSPLFEHRSPAPAAVSSPPPIASEETLETAPSRPAATVPRARPLADPLTLLRRATRELRDASTSERVCDVLLDFCAQHFTRSLLLALRDARIVGWRGRGMGLDAAALRQISLDAMAPSVFFSVSKGAQFWLGPLPRLPVHQSLVAALGGDAPTECVVMPIFLRDRVLAFLYADNVERVTTARPPLFALRRLVHKAGLAYEVCVLRHKIGRA